MLGSILRRHEATTLRDQTDRQVMARSIREVTSVITAAMVVTPVMRSLISGRVALLLLLGCHRHCDEPAAGRTGVDANCTTTDDDGSVDAEIFAPRTPAEVMKCGKGPDHQESARSLKVIDHDLALAEKHGFRPIDESTQSLVDENAIPSSRHWLPRLLLPEASPRVPRRLDG